MKKLGSILILCTLLSCHSHRYAPVPANVIQPDTMINVLTDVHILQAKIQMGYYVNDTTHSSEKAFQELWKKHNITEKQYDSSIKYYTYHTDELNDMYEKVLSNLSEQKAELLGKKHP